MWIQMRMSVRTGVVLYVYYGVALYVYYDIMV